MNILITGASGLIGSALQQTLKQDGHQLFIMQRPLKADADFSWQPDKNMIHWDKTKPIDAVIHLAGANIANGRWTAARKKLIIDSREQSTLLLANTLAQLAQPPKLFISGSAIGFYGDTGAQSVDEDSPLGSGFLAEICKRWEAATQAATDAGIRTIHMRTSIVLSPKGGALRQMLTPFKLGLGGRVGSGQQYMSWVSLPEIINMIRFLLSNEQLSGPVNLASKTAVNNAEFSRMLGQVLHRPTVLPLPAFMVRLIFGEMGDALLLSSSRVYPKKLEQAGYIFMDTDLKQALNRVLNST
ncbi:TIGR01777 family oxidoreductase [Candidatus Venteria ishoeyi]|uniref:TIGR01777 family oxidoreductase n=1 Tax=Candidatus Venteria ishoeyi TaxID=1899563 RepID=UPI0025A5C193|nr:TIGR01777 family oxidoreductase [Candidatus Venteria ishoeyi]MDM8545599.1 TIGR01777 family oxidoreductase [Candidatus Venteria ishoeyi]